MLRPSRASSRLVLAATAIACLTAVVRLELSADDWPEWRGSGRLGVWNETGILDDFPASGLAGPLADADQLRAMPGRRWPAVACSSPTRAGPAPTTAIERALALDETSGAILWTHEWETDYSGAAADLRDRPARHADRRRRSRVRARRDGPSRRARRGDRTRDLAEGLRPGLRCVGAVVGNGRRAARRRRSSDRARRRRAEREGRSRSTSTPARRSGARCRPTGSRATTSRSSSRRAASASSIICHPRAVSALDPATGKVYWEVPIRGRDGHDRRDPGPQRIASASSRRITTAPAC